MPPSILTCEEREVPERWACRPKAAQALAQRARFVLACAEGCPNTAVVVALRVRQPTVGKWRRRFLAKRLDGLLNKPRNHLYFTPTGASWINLVERWFRTLTTKQLRRGSIEARGNSRWPSPAASGFTANSPSRSCGLKRRMTLLSASHDVVYGSLTQDTSHRWRSPSAKLAHGLIHRGRTLPDHLHGVRHDVPA